jgi:hypothetical protein
MTIISLFSLISSDLQPLMARHQRKGTVVDIRAIVGEPCAASVQRKRRVTSGSVFLQARKIGGEGSSSEDSRQSEGEKEIIVSELSSPTSDSSLQLTSREDTEPSEDIPRRPGRLRPDNEIAIKAAIFRLVALSKPREAAIRSVSNSVSRHLYLEVANGQVVGVYGLERSGLRRLTGQGRDLVPLVQVRRWLRLEGLGFRLVLGFEYRQADAFEL